MELVRPKIDDARVEMLRKSTLWALTGGKVDTWTENA